MSNTGGSRTLLKSATRIGLVLTLGLGLAGCAASALDMTASLPSFSNPLASKPTGSPVPVTMFIASTRPVEKTSIRRNGGEGTAHFSMATVDVPPQHHAGVIEQPSFGAPDPAKHFVVARNRSLSADEFKNSVATNLSGRVGSNRDILVFVHGYNTGFDEARLRLAQIVADGRFGGVPILFTWPTRGEITAYVSDKDSATASRDALTRMFLELSQIPDVGRIHVLAHSMGAWLAMEGLREAGIGGHAGLDGRLGEVMLAAPDIDLAVFRQQIARIGSPHVSVFVSSNDRALTLSSLIARDRPRVGAMNPRNEGERLELKRLGVTIYDISGAPRGMIGHDVYADAPQVIRLIGAELGRSRDDDSQVSAVLGNRDADTAATPTVSADDLPPPTTAAVN